MTFSVLSVDVAAAAADLGEALALDDEEEEEEDGAAANAAGTVTDALVLNKLSWPFSLSLLCFLTLRGAVLVPSVATGNAAGATDLAAVVGSARGWMVDAEDLARLREKLVIIVVVVTFVFGLRQTRDRHCSWLFNQPAAAAAASLRLFLMATGCTEAEAPRFNDSAPAASPPFSCDSSEAPVDARAAVASALLCLRAFDW